MLGGLKYALNSVLDLTMHFDRELDVKGLKCPLPILRTKKALSEMSPGEVLHVLATDPGSVKDFRPSPNRPVMSCCRAARQSGLRVLSQAQVEPGVCLVAGFSRPAARAQVRSMR
jgi:TusA-related sulfurtransferase